MNRSEKELELMKLLIGTDTTNPTENEKVLVDRIIDYLRLYPNEYKIIEFEQGRADLVININGRSKGKATAFVGHIDTVCVGDESEWTYSPFSGYFDGTYIYGRGASDMKGGVAAMIMLYEHLRKHPPEYPVKLLFTADEEKDGKGITAAVKAGEFDNVAEMIIAEPTSLKIGVCEKGAIWLKFTVTGKSCHAANPTKGVNALEHAIGFLNGLKISIESNAKKHPMLDKNSFQITQINSGIQINIIPDKAYANIDIRTVPFEKNTNKDILKIVDNSIKSYCDIHKSVSMRYDILGNRESIENKTDKPNVLKITNALKHLNIPQNFCGITYFTDGSIAVPKTDVPFVIFGPGFENECHCVNEKARLDEIISATDIYKEIVK